MIHFLSITWDVNPEIFSLGPLHLRYYGVLLVCGFVAAYYVLRKVFRKEGLPQHMLDSLAFTTAVSTIIGLRLGHCLFYQPEYYLAHPLEILMPWKGGLASHGGAVGILVGLWLWCRKYKAPYMWAIEHIILIVPLAGAFVRIGNLMNSEIYGGPTTLPWGFSFMRDSDWYRPLAAGGAGELPCHPTQIYEALAYLAIFFFMWYLYTRHLPKMKRGMLFGIFLILLFGGRFLIELNKNDQVPFEATLPLNMGQLLSLPFIIAGVVLLLWSWKKGQPAFTPPAWAANRQKGKKKF
jgi:prolipoprotein diacylglyceryl transferase